MEQNKILTRRMKYIIDLLKENKRPMTIEEISDFGTKELMDKGICTKYTYNQVGASAYGLVRRGIVIVDNIPEIQNPTSYNKDTIITLIL